MAVDLTDRAPFPLRERRDLGGAARRAVGRGRVPAQERDGHRLVDGIALVPVPTASVLEDGADVVVSVNLMSAETLERWPEGARARGRARRRRSRACSTRSSRSWTSASSTRASGTLRWPTSTITPRFGPADWRDFHLADLFLEAGRTAALEQLPQLQALSNSGGPGPCAAGDGSGSVRIAWTATATAHR